MSSETSNALNAIGTLIGYIGTEVATDDYFARLLWPRKSYNGFTWKHVAKMALLMPMGGPIHKAALSTLDGFYKHGLYERGHLGHMLGTAFYRDSNLEYKIYGDVSGHEIEYVRSGMWVKAVMSTPFPRPRKNPSDEESGKKVTHIKHLRQKVCVEHIKLFAIPHSTPSSTIPIIFDDAGPPTIRTYVALFTTEISATAFAILVATVWKSAFATLWLLPLTLKIVSTIFAVEREKLVIPNPKQQRPALAVDSELSGNKLYEIRAPAAGFILVEGPDDVVLQFFRHYGHPKRSKARENIQISIVVAFTLVFPLGLVCSTIWMTDTLQKVWVGYQLYTILSMYVYRYAGGHLWGTTEERVGQEFLRSEIESPNKALIVKLQGTGGGSIGAELERTCHDRYREAKSYVETLVDRRRQLSMNTWSRTTTVCEEVSSSD